MLIFVIVIVWLICNSHSTNIVSYYTNGDNDFRSQVRKILASSNWHKKYRIYETNDPEEATITINLTSREDMNEWHDNPQYYPSGKQIRFSITTQDFYNKPEIFIDQENWLHGVDESGLTVEQYREYVINHEFGHGLGYDHQPCNKNTAVNGVCPVLYQSTRGCPKGYKCGYKTLPVDFTKRLKFRYLDLV